MLIDGDCLLCNQEQESIDHIFFKCEYSMWVIKEAMEVLGALVWMETVGSLEDVAQELSKVTEGSPTWGLQWSMLGIVLFHIWKQHNQRRMQAKSDTVGVEQRSELGLIRGDSNVSARWQMNRGRCFNGTPCSCSSTIGMTEVSSG